jgi:hypothetical protein
VEFEITPEPSDEERAAIEAALAAAEEAQREPSPWPGAVVPPSET